MPFPFVDQPRLRRRPALVISNPDLTRLHGLLWVTMITSATNGGWSTDVSLVERFAECGLAVPCFIRTAKLSTVEANSAQTIGTLPQDILSTVMVFLRGNLGLT